MSSPSRRSTTMYLHQVLHCASLAQSSKFKCVHCLMLVLHVSLCLPRLLLPSTIPSNSAFCKVSCLRMCPKYLVFFFFIILISDLSSFIMFRTSRLVFFWVHGILINLL